MKHVLAAADGTFPSAHRGWEEKVLERELADHDLVGWYRNSSGTNASLRIPYEGTQFDRSMYPDFIMFHRTDDDIRPSIIDPHGYHLSDATAKLKGLADYAADHGNRFDRVDAVAEADGNLRALDLRSETVRDAIHFLTDGGIKELFKEHGGNCS